MADPKLLAKVLAQGGNADWMDLYRARQGANPDMQEVLAPMEHQAYAREAVQASPILGPLQQSVMIPAYTAGKAVGLINSRSPASWAELLKAYQGVGQGIASNLGFQ